MRAVDVLQRFFQDYSEPEQDALITLVEPPLGVLLTRIRTQIQAGTPVREACGAALDSGNAPAVREREVKARA